MRLNGKTLSVSLVDSPPYVEVSMDPNGGDPQMMTVIGVGDLN
jgi:hypothetical protein